MGLRRFRSRRKRSQAFFYSRIIYTKYISLLAGRKRQTLFRVKTKYSSKSLAGERKHELRAARNGSSGARVCMDEMTRPTQRAVRPSTPIRTGNTATYTLIVQCLVITVEAHLDGSRMYEQINLPRLTFRTALNRTEMPLCPINRAKV